MKSIELLAAIKAALLKMRNADGDNARLTYVARVELEAVLSKFEKDDPQSIILVEFINLLKMLEEENSTMH